VSKGPKFQSRGAMGPQEALEGVVASLQNGLLRMNARLYALEAAEALRGAGKKARRPVEFRSQFGEDWTIWELSGRRLEGFYVEVGAFDGYSLSATYALDCMGWDGVLIEPIPERYEECVRRRPNARVVHAALAGPGSSGTTQFYITEDMYGGMLSYLDPSSAHGKGMQSAKKRAVTVPLTTMNAVLAGHAGEIEAMVVDVEGGEVALLQGFDLLKFRPKLILVEDNGLPAANPLLETMLSFASYTEVARVAMNRVYVRSELAATATAYMRR
jgi:FkbM family methyltransferase